MRLTDLRQAVYDSTDWQPSTSADYVARLNRLINRAYNQFVIEAPFLFFEETLSLATQIDVTSSTSNTSDRLSIGGGDSYVLERPVGLTGISDFPTDGSWDGREIEIEDPDGIWHRRTIRETWVDSELSPAKNRLTIDRPWRNNSDSAMSYRIYTPYYYLPQDVIQLQGVGLWNETQVNPLKALLTKQVEASNWRGVRETSPAGVPFSFYRGPHKVLDGPKTAPTAVVPELPATLWSGPNPAGEFEYMFTYAWGYRDEEYEAPLGTREPLWESTESPPSAAVVVTYGGAAPTISLPNIEWMLNFGDNTTARYKRSGIYKRVYRRRATATGGSYANIESPEVWEYLTAVSGEVTTFTDNGSLHTDVRRRHFSVNGHQSIGFIPRPDARYDVDLRVIRRPAPLVNDYDAPRVHEEAIEVLLQKILVHVYGHLKDEKGQRKAEQTYANALHALRSRYGALTPDGFRKRLARPGRGFPASILTVDPNE